MTIHASKNKLEQLKIMENPNKTFHKEINEDKESLLVTFPFPYMNGKLHLGHLFTISKVEFYSRFKELQGFNVLFPFGFHCSGMPISASAKKLKEELAGEKVDNSVKKILKNLGYENYEDFTDPIFWIKTFPKLAIEHLKKFEINADFRKSFITTEYNPYFDSFVRWQFNLLNKKGYIFFGKRYSIFCPKDNQPCFDHDRMKGEGVEPISYDLLKIRIKEIKKEMSSNFEDLLKNKEIFFLGPYCSFNSKDSYKIIITKDISFFLVKIEEKYYFLEEDLIESFKRQVDCKILYKKTVEKIKEEFEFPENFSFNILEKKIKKFQIKGIKEEHKNTESKSKINKKEQNELENICKEKLSNSLNETANLIRIFIPEREVISRSGGVCVVSLTDQWFIDYGNKEWKEKTKRYLENLEATKQTKDELFKGIDWVNKWGFSRSFGLGTKIPFDEKYVIDSLSDSTVYMAFYTVQNYLFKDLEGKEEIFPTSLLSDEVWNYIFYNKEMGNKEVKENKELMQLLNNARKSFMHFYPVYLRVSGKDLLKNHLLFYLMNHAALFEEKYFPRRIFSNGHLMLNSEKMSKSTGNFLSVEDCHEKYGVHATRLCISSCGDFNEDANFEEKVANQCIIKLSNLKENIENYQKTIKISDKPILRDFLFGGISFLLNEAMKKYEEMAFKEATKYGFYEMLNLYNLYLEIGGNESSKSLDIFFNAILLIMQPVLCSFSDNLLEKNNYKKTFSEFKRLSCKEETNIFKYPIEIYEGLNFYIKQIKLIKRNAVKKKCKKIKLNLGKDLADWKQEILKAKEEEYNEIFSKYKISKKVGMAFAVYNETKSFDEMEILTEFKEYLEKITGLEILLEMNNKGEPYNPMVEYLKE